jgi:hypothetical protein
MRMSSPSEFAMLDELTGIVVLESISGERFLSGCEAD